jgi:hypothetical protein
LPPPRKKSDYAGDTTVGEEWKRPLQEPAPKANAQKTLIMLGSFLAVILAGIVAALFFFSQCTSDVAGVERSPDKTHAAIMTRTDCGATSGAVSIVLQRSGGQPSRTLYDSEPWPDLQLVWRGDRLLIVKISDPKMIGRTETFDGIKVRFERMPESN